ncbi:MAG TPA: hypothetical protein VF194_00320 [Ferrovibrio sp.]
MSFKAAAAELYLTPSVISHRATSRSAPPSPRWMRRTSRKA